TVTDIFPGGLTLLAAIPSQGTFDPATGVWAVGTVIPGVPQTLTLLARYDVPFALTNGAFVSHSDLPDPDPTNNGDTATVAPAGGRRRPGRDQDGGHPDAQRRRHRHLHRYAHQQRPQYRHQRVGH